MKKKNVKNFKKLKKKIKKQNIFPIIFSLILLLSIIFFVSYKLFNKEEKAYIINEDGIKFFPLEENQKIIKIEPEKEIDDGIKKPDEYEIYKLPKYDKNSLNKKK